MSPPPAPLPPQLLAEGLAALGLSLPADAVQGLLLFQAELQKWNSAYNLTAVRDPAGQVTRHLLDSLVVLPLMQGRVLDVGAGAGLPCIPLAIADPALRITGLDSNGKKARFMRHAGRTLGLSHFEVIESRVETVPAGAGYDTVTSRAFASLADFFTLTRHLLAPGGRWVAMKGKLEADELAAIPPDVRVIETLRLQVPGLAEARHAVIAQPASTTTDRAARDQQT